MNAARQGELAGSVLMRKKTIGIVAAMGAGVLSAAGPGMEPERVQGH